MPDKDAHVHFESVPVGRIGCLVPGCKRSRGQRKGEGPLYSTDEYVCGVHWSPVSKKYRKAYTRWKRSMRQRPHTQDKVVAGARLWRRLKRQAIERAMGIG